MAICFCCTRAGGCYSPEIASCSGLPWEWYSSRPSGNQAASIPIFRGVKEGQRRPPHVEPKPSQSQGGRLHSHEIRLCQEELVPIPSLQGSFSAEPLQLRTQPHRCCWGSNKGKQSPFCGSTNSSVSKLGHCSVAPISEPRHLNLKSSQTFCSGMVQASSATAKSRGNSISCPASLDFAVPEA